MGLGLWLPGPTSSLGRQGPSLCWGRPGRDTDTRTPPRCARVTGRLGARSRLPPDPSPFTPAHHSGGRAVARRACSRSPGRALCWHRVPPLMPQSGEQGAAGGIQIFQNAVRVLDRAEPGRVGARSRRQRLPGAARPAQRPEGREACCLWGGGWRRQGCPAWPRAVA